MRIDRSSALPRAHRVKFRRSEARSLMKGSVVEIAERGGSPAAARCPRRLWTELQTTSTVSQFVAVSPGSMTHVSLPDPPFTTSAEACAGTSVE